MRAMIFGGFPEWDEIVSEILAKGSKSLILDLRNNPGGFLDGAVFVSSEFLDGGDVVIQENGNGDKIPYKESPPASSPQGLVH